MGPTYKVIERKNNDTSSKLKTSEGVFNNETSKHLTLKIVQPTNHQITYFYKTQDDKIVIQRKKRNSETQEPNCKKKKTSDTMDLNYYQTSEDDSNTSSNRSPYSHEVHTLSSHSSISSDHDYLAGGDYNGLDPIEFNVVEHYTNDAINQGKPFLKIMEQPVEMFRFRYSSEMNGMHGSILGKSTKSETSKKKTYPTVKLFNYPNPAVIICTLVTDDSVISNYHPHYLSLRGRSDKVNIIDPVEKEVGKHNDYQVIYQGLAIVQTSKKQVCEELFKKRCTLFKMHNIALNQQQENDLRISCENMSKNININCVRFLFSAYDSITRKQICNAVWSDPVYNIKCTETGTLKISRMSKVRGNVAGGDEVFMFVEKVSKKNIKVRFYELNGSERVWEKDAIFSENDVHHQYGIVFRTPPYRDPDLQRDKRVYVELYRPKDGAVSSPKHFEYMAAPANHKRRRVASSVEYSSLESSDNMMKYRDFNISPVSTVPPDHLPTVVSMADKSLFKPNLLLENNVSLNSLVSGDLIGRLPSADLQNYSLEDSGFNFPMICADGDSLVKSETAEDGDSMLSETVKVAVKKIINFMETLYESTATNLDALAVRNIEFKFSKNNCIHHVLMISEHQQHLDTFIKFIKKFNLDYCLDFGNDDGDTALHIAATLDMHECIKKLLQAGANPNLLNKEGVSPLHLCVRGDNKDSMVQMLTASNYTLDPKQKLNVDLANGEGYTALHMAAASGSLASVSRLLLADADPNTRAADSGRTALHLAVSAGHLILVNYLLEEADIKVNVQGNDGETPLHIACMSDVHNTHLICKKLLDAGGSPFIPIENVTCVELVKQSSNSEVYNVFREKFPDMFTQRSNSSQQSMTNPSTSKKLSGISNENDEISRVFQKKFPKEIPTPSNKPPSKLSSKNSNIGESLTEQIETIGSLSLRDIESVEEEIEIKEEPSEYFYMDTKTSDIVISSLDASGLWKELAINLGYSDFVNVQLSSNFKKPSCLLLHLIEADNNVPLEQLHEALEKLNLKDAADAVKALLKDK